MPSILYLCSSWPLGKAFGGQLRALHVGRALQQIGEVTVVVVSADADDKEAEARTRTEFTTQSPIRPEPRPNRNWVEKLRWAFDARHLNVHGAVAPQAERERLLSSLTMYDLVWVLNSRTPNILQKWDWPGAHLDLDDLPSGFLAAEARNGSSLRQRLKAQALQPFFKRRERLFRERFTTLSVCSEADRQSLGGGRSHPRNPKRL